ncbi:hypothetical protein [Acaryochloris marina]|uniref:hypothetical protein n=1 Tax=Acaryochloris marina TaxID=155978 RepID=UPI0021C3D58D|nr:hypothetical protein [Acaryochloris marina]BDM83586.1 hypothetical protein AM10699_64470 [Acaryochloris marina MBIC10699]
MRSIAQDEVSIIQARELKLQGHERTISKINRGLSLMANSSAILVILVVFLAGSGLIVGVNLPKYAICDNQLNPCWWLRFGGSERKVLTNDKAAGL